MSELPKTEQELNDLINAKVQEKIDEETAKHNGQMANLRKKYEEDLRKAKEQAGKTAEELAQERIKEQQEADQKELNELRAYKKSAIITERLAKENLPAYLKNDSRLINADESTFEKALKEVKKDYELSLPRGATHSTIVQTSTTSSNSQQSEKEQAYEKMGEAIKQIIG